MFKYPTFRKHWVIVSETKISGLGGCFSIEYSDTIPANKFYVKITRHESEETIVYFNEIRIPNGKYPDNINILIFLAMFQIMLNEYIYITDEDELYSLFARYFWGEMHTTDDDETIVIDDMTQQKNYVEMFIRNIGSSNREGEIIIECPVCDDPKIYSFPQNPAKISGISPGRSFKLKVALPGYEPEIDEIIIRKHF